MQSFLREKRGGKKIRGEDFHGRNYRGRDSLQEKYRKGKVRVGPFFPPPSPFPFSPVSPCFKQGGQKQKDRPLISSCL